MYQDYAATPEMEDKYGPLVPPELEQELANRVAGRILSGEHLAFIADSLVRDGYFAAAEATDFVQRVHQELVSAC